MSDFRIEVPSTAIGFLVGAAFWLVAALVCPRRGTGTRRKATVKTKEIAEPAAREPPPRRTGEPGPEPAPASDCSQRSPGDGPVATPGKEPRARTSHRSVAARPLELQRLVAPGAVALLSLALAAALWAFAPSGGGPAESRPPAAARTAAPEATPTDCEAVLVGSPSSKEASNESSGDADGFITFSLTRQQISIPQAEGTYYKTAYWGTIFVGEPPVPFSVVFDTGSGHLILPSTYCHTDTCRAHRRYRRSLSVTALDIDYDGSVVKPGEQREHITVSFGTGEVAGVFVEDVVCLGPELGGGARLFSDNTTAKRAGAVKLQRAGLLPDGCIGLRMIAATDMSEDPFKDFEFDGVLGLGLTGLSQAPEFNAMHVVSGMAPKVPGRMPHLFAVFLGDGEEESEITLGGYEDSRLEEGLAWQPVHTPSVGQWMVRVKSVRVDGQEPLGFCADGECRAIVDTGTSLIAAPSHVFPELFEMLTFPAVGQECLGPGPRLDIELEGITVTLEPKDYSLYEPPLPGLGPAGPNTTLEQESELCRAMLMALDLPAPLGPKLFVLGEPVLRRYYTVYDSGSTPRVGFGRARHGGRDRSQERRPPPSTKAP